jgi:ankyrin repeat protein/AAA domain-containing protein
MKILEYIGLDTSRVRATYAKVASAIAQGDFRAAQVKKLANLSHGKFYRAKLDDADRLLFCLVRHGDEVCALMLEVIANHDYDKSRFLRGAAIDESKIPDCDPTEAIREAQPVRYLHPERTAIHLLDKPISLDDAQEAIYRQAPPLIVVGSAGSGKTALTLEKLKHVEGEVLYVTHSAYLAQNARDLYYANGFEHPGQEAVFLSYFEFIESIHVPAGREATWRDFAGWFARMRQAFKDIDAHQAFEEIRGVITAGAGGVLTREDYQALGVRQSIFPADRRDALYDLFEKYRAWLAEARCFDLNLIAQEWQTLAAPRYDFVVIDEVQDITSVQLALVLKTLKKPGHFLLCGDSNQIVHPNFFSWGQVKTLFWRDPQLAERQEVRVLTANFRNGREASHVANQLLKIKQRRFGSIDRESNFLVQAVGGDEGQVLLMADKEGAKKELDQKIRQSTQFAVLVMRDEDKAEARKHFATPLLFSIHEAKGLEYENIVLYRFVSDHRAEFAEIVAGVAKQDLAADSLEYRRARDKGDKSLEVYKFFVNALYVALTRATQNLYIIESDTAHPLFGLLELSLSGPVTLETKRSSLEDWQKEARKLELQGKQEQAEAIRRDILKQTPVPWLVFDEIKTTELLVKVFREQAPGGKLRQQLYEIATCHDEPALAAWLAQEAKFDAAKGFEHQRLTLGRKSYASYFANHFKDILRQCEQHGIDHRLPMNQTPLMAAAAAGNVRLVEALLERGANPEAIDHYGCNALHWAMREAFRDAKFARGPFAALFELLAPASIDVSTEERLVRIDRHLAEYLLFQTLWALFKSRFTHRQRRPYGAFETQAILEAWDQLPANVLRSQRNKRQHLSNVLSRNEVERDYTYNRALFVRVTHGWYQFNPKLAVRRREGDADVWVPIYQALNLPFIGEFAWDFVWGRIDEYLVMAGLPERTIPIPAERAIARQEAAARDREKWERDQPKWGTTRG